MGTQNAETTALSIKSDNNDCGAWHQQLHANHSLWYPTNKSNVMSELQNHNVWKWLNLQAFMFHLHFDTFSWLTHNRNVCHNSTLANCITANTSSTNNTEWRWATTNTTATGLLRFVVYTTEKACWNFTRNDFFQATRLLSLSIFHLLLVASSSRS
jgi:hypothetical protein